MRACDAHICANFVSLMCACVHLLTSTRPSFHHHVVCVQLEIFQFKRFYENVRGKLSQIVKKDYNTTIRQLDTLPFRSRCAFVFWAYGCNFRQNVLATVAMEITISYRHAHFRFKGSSDQIKSLSGNLKRTNSSHR